MNQTARTRAAWPIATRPSRTECYQSVRIEKRAALGGSFRPHENVPSVSLPKQLSLHGVYAFLLGLRVEGRRFRVLGRRLGGVEVEEGVAGLPALGDIRPW